MVHDPVFLLGPYLFAGLAFAGVIGWVVNIGVYQAADRSIWFIAVLGGALFLVTTTARAYALHQAGKQIGNTKQWVLRLPLCYINELIALAIRGALTLIPNVMATLVGYWLLSRGAPTLALILQVLAGLVGFLLFLCTSGLFSYVLIESILGRHGGMTALLNAPLRFLRDPIMTTLLVIVGFFCTTLGSALVLLGPPAHCYADLILFERWNRHQEKKM